MRRLLLTCFALPALPFVQLSTSCLGRRFAQRRWALSVDLERSEMWDIHLDKPGHIPQKVLDQAAEAIRTGGFALVRGPCFSDAGLARAQALAEEELSKVKSQAEQLGLASLAPWARPKPSLGAGNLFRFQEGASFSSGRLDMPLKSGTGALASREDLKELCEKLFRAPCVHSGRGAFWNFPNSGPEHWHRDGQLPLLTAVTVAKGYPKNAGFLRLQPFTHHGAIDEDADSHREPKVRAEVHAGESERVAAILQPGDLLLFLYSTKHAAVPNLSDQDRCLLYSVYGPENVQDEINCCDGRPSLKTYSKAEAEILLMMANALQ
ncbi:unnamed protein product [Durusdinium trenchii]|uniref:Phytanoyl-CoA dioxygenase n=1 Tax=Durusdinium trenchii TaxID=1381693 RepID=A0ABP0QNS4_9DINO